MLELTFSYCLNFNSKDKYTATNNTNLFEGVFMTDSIMRIGIIAIVFIILGLAVLNLTGFFEEKPWSPAMTSGNTISLNAIRGENGATPVLEVTPPIAVPVVTHTSIGSPPSDVPQLTQTTEFSRNSRYFRNRSSSISYFYRTAAIGCISTSTND